MKVFISKDQGKKAKIRNLSEQISEAKARDQDERIIDLSEDLRILQRQLKPEAFSKDKITIR